MRTSNDPVYPMRDCNLQVLISFLLILAGSNLFVYTTTRQRVTEDVLTRARDHVEIALLEGISDDELYAIDMQRYHRLIGGISGAGGMYYWWNEALWLWVLSGLLIISGLLLLLVKPNAEPEPSG